MVKFTILQEANIGLALTRAIEQAIILVLPNGQRIVVKVIGMKERRVMLHLDIPDNVTVIRQEIDK